MTASPTLDYTRRLIERRYGRSLHHLTRDANFRNPDPVLHAVVRQYRALARTDHALRLQRQRLERLVSSGTDSIPDPAPIIERTCHIHALAERREATLEVLWDLLDLPHTTSPAPKPAPVLRAAPQSAPDHIADLLPLARRLAAQTTGPLTRDALGAHVRAQGIAVGNQRLTDTLRHLRREARPAS
jgi:hypothetical protein